MPGKNHLKNMFALGCFCLSSLLCVGQDTLVTTAIISRPVKLMAIDELSNIYIVVEDHVLLQVNEKGDSISSFRGVYNGAIGRVDASNPLQLLLHYPKLNKAIILDRMLSIKWELDLSRVGVYNAAAVCMSQDGAVWAYDQFSAKLRKFDEQLHEMTDATDLRQLLGITPQAFFLVEHQRMVYLFDKQKGIFVFDQYGNYVRTIAILNDHEVQPIGNAFYALHDGKILWYDGLGLERKSFFLPIDVASTVSQVVVLGEKLYALTPTGLLILDGLQFRQNQKPRR